MSSYSWAIWNWSEDVTFEQFYTNALALGSYKAFLVNTWNNLAIPVLKWVAFYLWRMTLTTDFHLPTMFSNGVAIRVGQIHNKTIECIGTLATEMSRINTRMTGSRHSLLGSRHFVASKGQRWLLYVNIFTSAITEPFSVRVRNQTPFRVLFTNRKCIPALWIWNNCFRGRHTIDHALWLCSDPVLCYMSKILQLSVNKSIFALHWVHICEKWLL